MATKAFRAYKLDDGRFHVVGASGDTLTTASLQAATHFSEYCSRIHSSTTHDQSGKSSAQKGGTIRPAHHQVRAPGAGA
jgi:hypothetical protein